jgi:signal transduction histidine kinase
MVNNHIDKRVIQILRWSIIVQIIFLALSSFSPRILIRNNLLGIEMDYWAVVAILLMFAILGVLYIKKFEEAITRFLFLLILYALALITILSRHLFSLTIIRRPEPFQNISLFRWDAIFFLIIPLVFIAWQYKMREVVIYSIIILIAEGFPLFLQQEPAGVFFAAANFLGSFARSGIFIIVGWIENRLVMLQRSQHEQLIEANQKLREYALASEKLAQTQERNRLARELHDTLAHTLSSSSVQLEAIKALFDRNPSEAKKMLSRTLENTKNGLAETRRALVDLRSSELEAYGLTQALKNMVSSAADRAGFITEFHLEKELDMLPEDITHCLYRCAQEAIENTLRHANAKKVTVNLMADGDEVVLSIRDNGKGFEPQELDKEHLGIRGMRERVEMLGGTLAIESAKKQGTEIKITLKRNHDSSDNL